MKRIFVLVFVLSVSLVASGVLQAGNDPFVGTWKLNLAKSKYVGQPTPKSLTKTVVAQGAAEKVTYEGVAADGSLLVYGYTTNLDGTDSPIFGQQPNGADTVTIKRVNANTLTGFSKKSGKKIFTTKAVVSKDGKLFGGATAAELESHVGYTKMSVAEIPPLVKRAVLLDFPKYKNMDILPERYEITPDDVDGALKAEGVEIKKGDAVLVRTGYSRFMTTDADAYLHKFAGMTAASARHLASKKIAVACSDNLAFGVPKPFELHQAFLVENGIFMIKSLNLEQLAKNGVYVSTLIVLPLKVRGATGSLVRPIALAPA